MNVTKCKATWEPSDVSFMSNKYQKIGGDHFTPPPYQSRVKNIENWIFQQGFLHQVQLSQLIQVNTQKKEASVQVMKQFVSQKN